MQKMCLNCEFFKQEKFHIENELTFGRCIHEEMSRYFHPERDIPGILLCCIHFKVKRNYTDLPEPDVAICNDSRTRGARSVLDALEKKNPSLRKEATDETHV